MFKIFCFLFSLNFQFGKKSGSGFGFVEGGGCVGEPFVVHIALEGVVLAVGVATTAILTKVPLSVTSTNSHWSVVFKTLIFSFLFFY